jgi:hypothetical protein
MKYTSSISVHHVLDKSIELRPLNATVTVSVELSHSFPNLLWAHVAGHAHQHHNLVEGHGEFVLVERTRTISVVLHVDLVDELTCLMFTRVIEMASTPMLMHSSLVHSTLVHSHAFVAHSALVESSLIETSLVACILVHSVTGVIVVHLINLFQTQSKLALKAIIQQKCIVAKIIFHYRHKKQLE